jgi:hypothetical protein
MAEKKRHVNVPPRPLGYYIFSFTAGPSPQNIIAADPSTPPTPTIRVALGDPPLENEGGVDFCPWNVVSRQHWCDISSWQGILHFSEESNKIATEFCPKKKYECCKIPTNNMVNAAINRASLRQCAMAMAMTGNAGCQCTCTIPEEAITKREDHHTSNNQPNKGTAADVDEIDVQLTKATSFSTKSFVVFYDTANTLLLTYIYCRNN